MSTYITSNQSLNFEENVFNHEYKLMSVQDFLTNYNSNILFSVKVETAEKVVFFCKLTGRRNDIVLMSKTLQGELNDSAGIPRSIQIHRIIEIFDHESTTHICVMCLYNEAVKNILVDYDWYKQHHAYLTDGISKASFIDLWNLSNAQNANQTQSSEKPLISTQQSEKKTTSSKSKENTREPSGGDSLLEGFIIITIFVMVLGLIIKCCGGDPSFLVPDSSYHSVEPRHTYIDSVKVKDIKTINYSINKS